MVRFAHIADCHLGAFGRKPELREYNIKAFEDAIEKCIERQVDFIIIAGDLFHNPLPDMDIVNRTVKLLMKVKNAGIRTYAVYGSHDYNLARASLIDVLESAELFKNVVNYLESENRLTTVKDKTGVSITGLSGRKNRLEKGYYEQIEFDTPDGDSIFVFHSPIAEMKPVDIPDKNVVPISSLPDGYDYYAGGHIHRPLEDLKDGKPVIFSGTTFGSSYTDLEREEKRGFYMVEDWRPEYVPVDVCSMVKVLVDAEGFTASEVEEMLIEKAEAVLEGDIVLVRVQGKLFKGSPQDIDFASIINLLESDGERTVFLNKNSLEAERVEKVKVDEEREEVIEKKVFEEQGTPEGTQGDLGERLLRILKSEKKEGETTTDYENRIWHQTRSLIENIKEEGELEEKPEKELDPQKPSQLTLESYGGAPE